MTSSWVRTGGARATTVTTTLTPSASATAWPTLDHSMMANARDENMEEGEETRTVRLVEPPMDDLSQEEIRMVTDRAMDDETEERGGARGRGRFMDD